MGISRTELSVNGVRYAALSCGSEGPLALCLHGFPDTPHTWRHLLPALADAGYRAVAPWLRGYAPTDVAPDGDYSVATLAADVAALHEALGGDENAVLVGHDWGAIIGYAAAAEPGRFRRLVTLAVPPPGTAAKAFLSYDQLRRSFYVMLFQTPLAEFAVRDQDLRFIERLWADWSPGYDASGDLPWVKDALRDPANTAAAIGYYRAMFGAGVPQDVPAAPTVYLHGRQDGAFGIEGTEGAETELPAGSQVERIDGVGHFLHLERPELINRLILQCFDLGTNPGDDDDDSARSRHDAVSGTS